jgi:hypothetical protein
MLLPPLVPLPVPAVLELPPVAPPEAAPPDELPELPPVVLVDDPEVGVLQADMHSARQTIVRRRIIGLLHTALRQVAVYFGVSSTTRPLGPPLWSVQ